MHADTYIILGNALMIPDEFANAVAQFPAVLQKLIVDELDAGNRILEIGSGYPAPPIGVCLKLANRITTRPRCSDAQLKFVFRDHSGSHRSEITDSQKLFFVLEPPHPDAGAYPDMDAIRAEMEARQRAADADMNRSSRS
jgi:hypothetical protein